MTKLQSLWAALKSGAWTSVLATVLGIGVTIGLLTLDQSHVLLDVAAGLVNLVSLIGTAVHAFGRASQIRQLVVLKAGPDGVHRPVQ